MRLWTWWFLWIHGSHAFILGRSPYNIPKPITRQGQPTVTNPPPARNIAVSMRGGASSRTMTDSLQVVWKQYQEMSATLLTTIQPYWMAFQQHPTVQAMLAWILHFVSKLWQELQELSSWQCGIVIASTIMGIAWGTILAQWRQNSRPFRETMDIPSRYYGSQAPWIQGRVVSVSDGDTFRLWHVPQYSLWAPTRPPKIRALSNVTLPIRLATIDTPETAKFGKSGQPYGIEAKQALQEQIDGQMIQLQLLTRDQYGRSVAQVNVVPRRRKWLYLLTWWWHVLRWCLGRGRSVGVEEVLLSAGLAEVYQGMGAVYGPKGKEYYEELQEQAKAAKRGMWSLGHGRESAAEYKQRTK